MYLELTYIKSHKKQLICVDFSRLLCPSDVTIFILVYGGHKEFINSCMCCREAWLSLVSHQCLNYHPWIKQLLSVPSYFSPTTTSFI